MKSANEVLASMKPDESLVDKYLSSIENIIDIKIFISNLRFFDLGNNFYYVII